MTLEEAIKHCEEKSCGNTECAAEHKQLSEWLKELQRYRQVYPLTDIKKKMATNKLFIESVYSNASGKTMEKKMAEWLRPCIGYVVDRDAMTGFLEQMRNYQDRLLKENPRLSPISISFHYDDSRYSCGVHFLNFGCFHASLRDVAGFITKA